MAKARPRDPTTMPWRHLIADLLREVDARPLGERVAGLQALEEALREAREALEQEAAAQLTYRLLDFRKHPAIQCLLCHAISNHPKDIHNRYCGRCHLFHDAVAEARRVYQELGAAHECHEWRVAGGSTCAVCGEPVQGLCLHTWDEVAILHRAPIDATNPQAHTRVHLLGCQACRTVDAFPPGNAALVLRDYVDTLRRALAVGGWHLPKGIRWYGLPGDWI